MHENVLVLIIKEVCRSQSYNPPCKPANPNSETLEPHMPAPRMRCIVEAFFKIVLVEAWLTKSIYNEL